MEAKPDVSLVTGSIHILGVKEDNSVVKNESAMVERNNMSVVANMGAANAGELYFKHSPGMWRLLKNPIEIVGHIENKYKYTL
jgi:hypothetical protein